jgi:hypothetical protein
MKRGVAEIRPLVTWVDRRPDLFAAIAVLSARSCLGFSRSLSVVCLLGFLVVLVGGDLAYVMP